MRVRARITEPSTGAIETPATRTESRKSLVRDQTVARVDIASFTG